MSRQRWKPLESVEEDVRPGDYKTFTEESFRFSASLRLNLKPFYTLRGVTADYFGLYIILVMDVNHVNHKPSTQSMIQ